MACKSYSDEFKIEAVRQVTDRGYKPQDVDDRLDSFSNSFYQQLTAQLLIEALV